MLLLVELKTNLSKSNDVRAGSGNTERRRGSNSQTYKSRMLEKAKEVKTPELLAYSRGKPAFLRAHIVYCAANRLHIIPNTVS